jgi:hypothetical protein
VSEPTRELAYTTRRLDPALVAILQKIKPGQKVRITQTVRVGMKSWTATVTGAFRGVSALATGIATDRDPQDDIIVPTVHFTKDNGELSSITLDEQSKVEMIEQ